MNIYYIDLNLFTSSKLALDLLEKLHHLDSNTRINLSALILYSRLNKYKSDEHIRYSNPLHSERLSGENAT